VLTDQGRRTVHLKERGSPAELLLSDKQHDQLVSVMRGFQRLTTKNYPAARKSTEFGDNASVEAALTIDYLGRDSESGSGIFSIRANDYIGVIAIDDLIISIHPKIELKHFLYIISQGTKWNIFKRDDSIELGETVDDFLEIVATWFLQEVTRLLPDRLLQDYRPIEDYTSTVRGTIFTRQTTEALLLGNLAVFNRFEIFDVDTPQNRLLKHAVQLVAQFRTLPDSILGRARALWSSLDEIGSYQQSDFRAPIDRRYLSMGFAPALDLARRIISAGGYQSTSSDILARPFLLRTHDLVELGMMTILARDLADSFKVSKTTINYDVVKHASPDLVFQSRLSGQTVATGDVKYKLDASWLEERSDLYQATYFATAANVKLGSTIYFSEVHREPDMTEQPGNLQLAQFFWNCNASSAPDDSRKTLVSSVREWLQTE
jgi:hypothetical protein